ncbi:MAG: ChbG/HpnK family deacetylase [Sedimentisphaerales bacterium]|nr:ChbG/HpnK family deacetylase [Sedimentisphaerales bacterium]
MAKRMIINADDFGLCEGVNKAVIEAHKNGVLTSTTIMANMPAVDQAIHFAKDNPSLGVGIHLNVLQGKPLSPDNSIKLLTNDSGEFKYSAYKLAIETLLCKKTRQAIEIELTSQIASVIDKGIKPTHLDSHKHFHCLEPVYKIVCSLADKFGIRAIRWPWEPATVCSKDWPDIELKDKFRAFLVRQMALKAQKLDNRFIKNDIFFGLAHTGRIDDNFWAEIAQTQFAGTAEVMTHPGYADGLGKTRLVQQRRSELECLCNPATKKLLTQAGIQLVHYGNIDGT